MSVIFDPLSGQLLLIPSLTFPGTLVISSGKTFTVNNTLTLAGTDGTTMTFPTTSATLARTDAAQTFTGRQTIDSLTISGNLSAAAWTTSGVRMIGTSGTLTDTSSSGTVATAYTDVLGGNTIAASSAATFTNYVGAWFNNPVAGTNVTLTSKWALGADSLLLGGTAVAGTFAAPQIQFAYNAGDAKVYSASNVLWIVKGNYGIAISSVNGAISLSQDFDTFVVRDAPNTMSQRNSTSAQKNRIYNTFTTISTAGEWFKQDWITTANQFRFGAVKGSSTGTARVASWDYGGLEASPVAAITVPITSGNVVFGGGITLADAGDIVVNATTGTKIGTATSQKIGFYNTTPVVQRADMSALIDSTTGTPGLTLGDVGVVFSQSAINNNFSSVLTQINKVRTALRDLGLMA